MSQRKKRRKQAQSQPQPKRQSARKRRKASHTRSNPGAMLPVMLANPHKAAPARTSARKRRRPAASSGGARHSARRRRSNPHQGARQALVPHKGQKLTVRRRRRANPVMGFSLATVLRVGAFGAAGIISARVFGSLYTKHLSDMVRGEDAKADPKNWRNHLDEFLRLVTMEAGLFAVDRVLMKLKGRPADRLAYLVGGTAEVARQGVGVVLSVVSPDTDRKSYGLDGLYEGSASEVPQGYTLDDGRVFVLDATGKQYVEVPPSALNGLEFRSTFTPEGNGMNGITMSRDAFGRGGAVGF